MASISRYIQQVHIPAHPKPHVQQAIHGLCRHGRLTEAMQALLCLGDTSFLSSSVPSVLLDLCIERDARKEGRLIHNHLKCTGYQSDLRLDNKLVIFYGKIGDIENARMVFSKMTNMSLVSWTKMLCVYSQNGFHNEAMETFILMQRHGFRPNQFSFGSVLRACSGMSCIRKGSQIHGNAVKYGLTEENRFVQTALVDLYAKCSLLEDARYLFDTMKEKDLVSWNTMIGGYAVTGLVRESFKLLHHILRNGNLPDHFTFSNILKACCKENSTYVYQLHKLIIQLGLSDDRIVAGSLLDAYAKCKAMKSAKYIYDSLPNTDLIACTALITRYSHEKSSTQEGFELVCKLIQNGLKMDDVIVCSVLSLCADAAFLSLGRQIHAYAIKNQSYIDLAIRNSLINMYAKSGEIKDARHAFDEMKYKNIISWTTMIDGYGKHGYGENALCLFEEMEFDGVKPNEVTFLSLLFACSHSGLTNKGWDCYNAMVNKYNIHPRTEHYSCIVDLLARGGMLEEAYSFVCGLDCRLSASVWAALLGACSMNASMPLGKVAAGIVCSVDPKSSVNYIVLSNLYGMMGLWEESSNIRMLLEHKYLRKVPGQSLLQIPK